MNKSDQDLIDRWCHIKRRPIYHLIHAGIATLAVFVSALTFYESHKISPIREYIPTTSADTAVTPIDTRKAILPTPNQDTKPGETFTEEETIVLIKDYIATALRDCFTMNYMNFSSVMSQCKQVHLDSESSTSDDYAGLLLSSGHIGVLKKHKTASNVTIDEESIELVNSGTVSFSKYRSRFVWIFELNMNIDYIELESDTASRWRIEVVRESAFNKAFAASIFKIIALN